MLPLMEGDGHADGDGLRDAVAARGEADALEAVDDEHPEDGGRQHMADTPPPQAPCRPGSRTPEKAESG